MADKKKDEVAAQNGTAEADKKDSRDVKTDKSKRSCCSCGLFGGSTDKDKTKKKGSETENGKATDNKQAADGKKDGDA